MVINPEIIVGQLNIQCHHSRYGSNQSEKSMRIRQSLVLVHYIGE